LMSGNRAAIVICGIIFCIFLFLECRGMK
jgi:hypothetical protein